jgi:glycosyltransferase involved in cell wall biosynthesis
MSQIINSMTETKKKVLIFSTAYFPFVGGAEISVKEITDRLSNEFDFDLITARFNKDLPRFEKIGSVNVYRLGSGKKLFDKVFLPFRGAILSYKLSKSKNYYCFWGIMATFGSGAGYICNIFRKITGKKKVPMVLTLQEGDSENHLNYRWFGLIALSWKLALRQTNVLTGLSGFLIKRARKSGFKGEAVLVPNGVDLALFTKEIDEQTKNRIKKDLGKNENDVFLVTTSRLNHKNAVDDVIRSLKLLPENISFIVIGKGEDGFKLQKLADTLGVADRVKFLGFIPYQDLPAHLSVCDIFVRPSRSEGFGNSFIEAMAIGLPVIATPVGGIPDFIDDRLTGLFCAPDSPQSIAKSVETILGDKELVEGILRRAKERVVERYNWDQIAKEMKKVFDMLD